MFCSGYFHHFWYGSVFNVPGIIILFLVWIWNGLGSTTMMRQSCSKDWMISLPPLPIRLGLSSPLCPTGTKQPMELEHPMDDFHSPAANSPNCFDPSTQSACTQVCTSTICFCLCVITLVGYILPFSAAQMNLSASGVSACLLYTSYKTATVFISLKRFVIKHIINLCFS